MPTPKQRYVKKLNEIAARYGKRENATVRATWRMLRDLRGQILAELAGAKGFQAFRLAQMRVSVDRYIAEFERDAGGETRDAMRVAYETGGESVVQPLQELGELQVGFFTPSPAQLNTVLDYSADLVSGIGDETRKAVNLQLRMTALGQKAPLDAMREITRQFGLVDLRQGREVVKGISYRAERVLRTELQRVYNLSSHSQQQETAKQVPGLLKSWVATADSRTRPEHLRAHMEYMANPIPVDEVFIVGGEEAMYPLDPNLSAANSIHCRCRQITIHPAIGRIGSPLDARIAKEMKRRERAVPERRDLTSEEIRERVLATERLHKDAGAMLEKEIAELSSKMDRATLETEAKKEQWHKWWAERDEKRTRMYAMRDERREAAHELLKVKTPAEAAVNIVSHAKKARKGWEAGLERFNELVGLRSLDGRTVRLMSAGVKRAHFDLPNTVAMETTQTVVDATHTMVHEMGHWLEYVDSNVRAKAVAFLRRRTEGERNAWLGDRFAKAENGKKDKFLSPYMGRNYPSYQGREFTEIVSMGLQYLSERPLELARGDPDYFRFMVDLLRGR